jgi:hypothetical protein
MRLAGLTLACLVGFSVSARAADPPPLPAAPTGPVPAPAAAPPATAASGDQVVWVARPKPPIFVDRTSGGSLVLGGALGAIAQMSQGADDVTTDHIADPANDLAAKVAALYAPILHASIASTPVADGGIRLNWNAKAYGAVTGGARYVVDVQTRQTGTVWASYVTWPLDFTHYVAHYRGVVKVEDVQAGKEVYRGDCDVYTSRRPGLPTHDEMYADSGAVLKTMLVETTDQCLAKLQSQGLGAPAAPTN